MCAELPVTTATEFAEEYTQIDRYPLDISGLTFHTLVIARDLEQFGNAIWEVILFIVIGIYGLPSIVAHYTQCIIGQKKKQTKPWRATEIFQSSERK